MRYPIGLEPEDFRRTHRRAKNAKRAGGVKPFRVMARVDGVVELARDLDSDVKRLGQLSTR